MGVKIIILLSFCHAYLISVLAANPIAVLSTFLLSTYKHFNCNLKETKTATDYLLKSEPMKTPSYVA